MNLYVSRHGETISNIERRLTGRSDSPLTPKGIEQAKALNKSLDGVIFDAVFCSPLKRAVQTVDAIFGGGISIYTDDRLAEISLGVMEGLTFSEANEKYPDSGMLFFTDPLLYKTPPEGENLTDMLGRIISFISDIEKSGHENVFALTHGYAMRVLYACISGDKSIAAIAGAPAFTNCDLAKFTYSGGKWALKS